MTMTPRQHRGCLVLYVGAIVVGVLVIAAAFFASS